MTQKQEPVFVWPANCLSVSSLSLSCARTRALSHARKSASLPLRLSAVSAFTSQQLCHFSELMFQPKAITTAGLCLPSHSSVETKIRVDQRCVVFKKRRSKCGSLLMLPCPACCGRVWKAMGEVGWQLRVVEGRGFSLGLLLQ